MGRILEGREKPGGLEGREEFFVTDIDGIQYVVTAQNIAGLASGGGIDDVLGIEQALTEARTIDVDTHQLTVNMEDGSIVYIGGSLGLGQQAVAVNAELSSTYAQSDLNSQFSSSRLNAIVCYSDTSVSQIETSHFLCEIYCIFI